MSTTLRTKPVDGWQGLDKAIFTYAGVNINANDSQNFPKTSTHSAPRPLQFKLTQTPVLILLKHLLALAYESAGDDALRIYVYPRKVQSAIFITPIQGVYAYVSSRKNPDDHVIIHG